MLLEWLNAAVSSESYQRVSQIIHDIKSATAAGDTAAHDGVWWHVQRLDENIPLEKRRRRREIHKLTARICASLRGYIFHPRLSFLMTGNRRWWFDLCGDRVSNDYRFNRANGRRIYEADAVFGVLRLAS